MDNSNILTLNFLEFHPAVAADTIEAIDPTDAAAFLDSVPARLCAPIMSEAVPWAAALWAELLEPAHAAAVLRDMPYEDATTVLRLVADGAREQVLAMLPSGLQRSFRRSLTYPAGTVGAWMDHSVPVFDETATAADGLKYLKSKRGHGALHLVVVGQGKSLSGVVSASDLLRAKTTAALSEICDRAVEPLSNRSMLASVADNPAWDRLSSLPVVGRKGNVLGSLERSSLRKGLSEANQSNVAVSADSVLAQLFVSYFAVIPGLLRILVEPGATPISAATKETRHER